MAVLINMMFYDTGQFSRDFSIKRAPLYHMKQKGWFIEYGKYQYGKYPQEHG